jgi:hypothetical protein
MLCALRPTYHSINKDCTSSQNLTDGAVAVCLRLLETENNGVQLGESFSFSDATKFGHDVWITRISQLGTPRRLTSTVQPVNIVSHCQPLSLCSVQVNTFPYLTLSWLLL